MTFGAQPASAVTVLDASTIQCTSPPGALATVAVSVHNPDGSFTLPGAFTYQLGIEIFFVYPALPVAGPITVYGAGFQSGLTLELGGVPISPTMVTPNQVVFTAPPGTGCSVALTITNPGGASASVGFNHAPEIASVAPSNGPAAGGTVVQLSGLWFYPGTTVTVGGAPAVMQSLSFGSMLLLTPPGQPGPAPVVVTSPTGCTAATVFVYE